MSPLIDSLNKFSVLLSIFLLFKLPPYSLYKYIAAETPRWFNLMTQMVEGWR